MVTVKCLIITILTAFFSQMLILYLFAPFDNTFDSLNQNEKILAHKIHLKRQRKEDEKQFKEIFEKTCRVNNSDALSALRRAKTLNCKYKIADMACQVQYGNLYPKSLPNYCPNNVLTYGKYLGCYKDQFNPRILPNVYEKSESNSIKSCLDLCLQGGFPYAGVEYGEECFCGNEEPPSSSQLPEKACNMRCTGAPGETCGASLTINIFETGLAKFIPAKHKEPSESSGGKANIVFLLTLSGRALRQIHRMINALYRRNHYFYIHVDARNDYLHRNLLPLEKRFPNIKIATKRFSTIWAGASYLTMILSSMDDFTNNLGWDWEFFIPGSESNFPIKSVEKLENFLSVNKNLNFVSNHGITVSKYISKQGLDKTFVECEERMWLIGDRDLPKGIVIDGASDWMALSREFISYVVGEKDELLNGLDVVFKQTLMSPETYFHTVLRNSIYCNTYVLNDLHYIKWRGDQGCQCHKKVVDWCGCSPLDFRNHDWDEINNTRDKHEYLSRKYEAVIDQNIINKIEEFIGFSDHDSMDTLNYYWENIYSHEDTTFPKNHDLLRSHAESISRINARYLKDEKCDLIPKSIVDVNLYKYLDVYWGNLVLHHALLEKKDVIIETWYRPNQQVTEKNHDSEFIKRVNIFEVSSDYDQKEKVFRNFANVLGTHSTPELLYEFSENGNNEETFIIKWVDPSGLVADISKIHINKKKLRNFVKPNLKTPITPGVWKAQLFENNNFIMATTFLIIPIELGEEIQETQIPKPPTTESFHEIYDDNSIDSQNTEVISNTKRKHGLEFIDEFNSQFYSIIETCVSQSSQIKEPIKCGDKVINICESSQWSSLYPDPKGTVGTFDESTGKLDRNKV